ncbi:MAG: deoC [Evtepia sp.]|nr:deoC [Evtepia sp.]
MDMQEILHKVDHTILKPEATWEEVKGICDEGIWASAASVCISPVYVAEAAGYLEGRLSICTAIGFPHGTSTVETKVWETRNAVKNGANEVDMVIHVGMVKAKRWDSILTELRTVKDACEGRLLKVIVEACLLNEEEKIRLCHLVSESGAEYIKTSTGYSRGGATVEDVALFRSQIASHVRIKAAGGIRSFDAAEAFLRAGADRIGSSSLVPIAKELEQRRISAT